MIARRTEEAAAQLEQVARELRSGSRPLAPELDEALRHEMDRRDAASTGEAWDPQVIDAIVAEGERSKAIVVDDLDHLHADMLDEFRRRKRQRT